VDVRKGSEETYEFSAEDFTGWTPKENEWFLQQFSVGATNSPSPETGQKRMLPPVAYWQWSQCEFCDWPLYAGWIHLFDSEG
jgi:hypothetical protein